MSKFIEIIKTIVDATDTDVIEVAEAYATDMHHTNQFNLTEIMVIRTIADAMIDEIREIEDQYIHVLVDTSSDSQPVSTPHYKIEATYYTPSEFRDVYGDSYEYSPAAAFKLVTLTFTDCNENILTIEGTSRERTTLSKNDSFELDITLLMDALAELRYHSVELTKLRNTTLS